MGRMRNESGTQLASRVTIFRYVLHALDGKRRLWWRSVFRRSNAREHGTCAGRRSGDLNFMPDMGAEVGGVALKLVGSRFGAECVIPVCALQTAFHGYLIRRCGSGLT